jgi:hypothetical protein
MLFRHTNDWQSVLVTLALSGTTILLTEARSNPPNDHNQDGEVGKFAKRTELARDLPVLWREPQDVDGRDTGLVDATWVCQGADSGQADWQTIRSVSEKGHRRFCF